MRIDLYLSKNGFAESRQKAKGLLDEGLVSVNGKVITKSSFDVSEMDSVQLTGVGLRYVGRGGLKLERALAAFSVDPSGLVAIDIGASTGGFTDCLLQHNAAKVYAVDAGTDQLHPKLRGDKRVICIENCNAKTLNENIIPEKIPLAVMDLSFISQTLIYPALRNILTDGATVITLIKPQFEAGKKALNKNGVVKDKKVHTEVIENLISVAKANSLYCTDIAVSPITGGDGNIEYLGKFIFNMDSEIPGTQTIKRTVFGVEK